MDNKPSHSYEGVRPAPGRDDSGLDPFEIDFRPEFRRNRGPREPFVNACGVVIGDHDYASAESPLERWTVDTDPAVMSGQQWVHPYKDIGFRTRENRDLFERGIRPQGGVFMHAQIQSSAADEPAGDPNSDAPEKAGGDDSGQSEWSDSEDEYVLDEP